jgi:hypothetical protein
MRKRCLFILLLAGCTASNWTKQGATTADLDRDYDECRVSAKPDSAIPAIAGAFGVVGVFVGTRYNDFRIRDCLQARGWARDGEEPAPTAAVATPGAPAPASVAGTPAPAPAPAVMPVNATEADSGVAKRLRDLQSLLDQGLISKHEYEERRQAILRGL